MSTSQASDSERLSFRTKFFFGAGGGAEAISLFTVSSYAMLFYNQVLGLPAALAGLAISVSLVLDGLSDPLVGSISDRTRSKLGRRHGYMFAAPIPIVLSLVAIFNPPKGMDQTGLFFWFALSVVCLRQAMTFFHTPHLALGGELSRDYTERSKVMAYNSFFAWAGGALTAWVALSYFFKATPEYPRGLLNPAPWGPYSMVMAAVTLVVLFASAWFTRDRIPHLPQPPKDLPKFSPFEFFRDIGKAVSNRNYLWLLVGYLFLSLMTGLRQGLHIYTNTFFWQLGSEQLRWFIIGSFFGFLFAFLAAARMHGRYDKRATMIVSAIVFAVAPAIPTVLGLMGLYFPVGSPMLLPSLIFFSVLSYGSSSVLSISIMSALADIADENELKFGLRQEGVLYATRSFFAKVDQALGAFLAGLALTFIRFPEKAHPGQVPEQIIWNLAFWDAVVAALPGVLAVVFYARYKITRESYEQTSAALRAKRAGAMAAGATSLSEDVPAPGGEPIAPAPIVRPAR